MSDYQPFFPDNTPESQGTESHPKNGLKIETTFCPTEVQDPFDTVEWDYRTAAIKDENGQVLFEQTECEVPASWSQLATNVVVSKYFYGEVRTEEREKSVKQLIHRVSRTIADWGVADGYFASEEDGERFYRDLTWLCLHQHGAFNSPVWFNVGLHHIYGITGDRCNWHWDEAEGKATQPENPYEFPQGSACFIQSVDDNMESIMGLAFSEAMLFKYGSGTGTDLSTIRSCREKLSGGGRPSGPLSFMRVYDQIAAVVKSGGKTRRAAKMQSLKVWHPDIMEFIDAKSKEEKKARILIENGYDSNFNSEAYSSVMFQNANLSIRVTDDFMDAVVKDKPWKTHWVNERSDGDTPTYPARDVLSKMAEGAWLCGDPGVQYDTTINNWHTCPNSGAINASNPCSEYMFLDDTACNLASINLMKFRQADGSFDVGRFQSACRLFFIAQEILVDHASYPTEQIATNSHLFRPLGLGFANLGSLLMSKGLPYDSDEGRGLCGCITSMLHGFANLTSAEMAAAVGPFARYEENAAPMLRVMKMHREAVKEIDSTAPSNLKAAAARIWDDVVKAGEEYGFRNAQATVLAPTGTISFLMDCDTTGIEPDIALVKYKQLAGGGMLKIINRTVPMALRSLGYAGDEIEAITSYIDKNDSIEGCPELKEEHFPVFDCAFPPPGGKRSISWHAHIKMMAAAQPFLSGAISKTVNMPKDVTPAEIAEAYLEGWRLGLKALAVYRDGSKGSQPLATSKSKKDAEPVEKIVQIEVAKPMRERLPDTRKSITHKFSVAGHEGYITVGLYDDDRPGELFITMAKEGSTIGGLMDCFGTAVSMSLQYGVPLEVYVNKFSHSRFDPMGPTRNPDIPIAKSVIDYIFRWMGMTFLDGYREANSPQAAMEAMDAKQAEEENPKSPTGAPEDPNGSMEEIDARKDAELEAVSTVKNENHGTNGHSKNGHKNGHKNGNGHPIQANGNGSSGTAILPPPSTAKSIVTPTGQAWNIRRMTSEHSDGGTVQVRNEQFAKFQTDAPACDTCGAITVRNGNCYLCHNCGNSMGCS
ncbi:Vitamin B12-dependent ribonucleotide reductase [Planctomycetales bacterium 10988]|nr:Vitamin B12-dependent ribonucleotide reductase [Planctomycetales bacterium 10988]